MLFFLPADVRKQGTAGRNRIGFPTPRTTTTTTTRKKPRVGAAHDGRPGETLELSTLSRSSPSGTFSQLMRTCWSRSLLLCSWWKPSACSNSCWMMPRSMQPETDSESSCCPPFRPTVDQHLGEGDDLQTGGVVQFILVAKLWSPPPSLSRTHLSSNSWSAHSLTPFCSRFWGSPAVQCEERSERRSSGGRRPWRQRSTFSRSHLGIWRVEGEGLFACASN